MQRQIFQRECTGGTKAGGEHIGALRKAEPIDQRVIEPEILLDDLQLLPDILPQDGADAIVQQYQPGEGKGLRRVFRAVGKVVPALDVGEIGRASCRERV